jgi:hypothetical protein
MAVELLSATGGINGFEEINVNGRTCKVSIEKL